MTCRTATSIASSNQTAVDHLNAWYRDGRFTDLQVALDPLMVQAEKHGSGEGMVAEFGQATQVAVRSALEPLVGLGPGASLDDAIPSDLRDAARASTSFEVDHILVGGSGATTQKVVESFDRPREGK